MVVGIEKIFFIYVDYLIAVSIKASINYSRRSACDLSPIVIYSGIILRIAVCTRSSDVYFIVSQISSASADVGKLGLIRVSRRVTDKGTVIKAKIFPPFAFRWICFLSLT